MNLPVPTRDEMLEFKGLYLKLYGVELTEEQAWEASTHVLQFFCLCSYGDGKKPDR